MEPFNKILHKELIALGWTHNRHKEYFEETGGAESGPRLYHEPAYDSYTMGKLVVIISKDGRVEDMFMEPDDDDDPNYPVS